MSDEKSTPPPVIKTVGAVASIVSFLEKAAVAFFMALLEYARIKQKRAEDELANEKVDTKIKEKQNAVQGQTEGKSSADVIDGFLAEHDGKGE